MILRWLVIAPLCTVLVLGICGVAQRKMDAILPDTREVELLYLPSEKLLTHFTAGLSSVVADFLWLKTIKYAIFEFHSSEHRFTWLEHMCRTVTRLDPYFEGVYVKGGMIMGAIDADEEAIAFLRSGLAENPESSPIAFELAQIYILNRRHLPESQALAAHYLNLAGEHSTEPARYVEWAARIEEQEGLEEDARSIWEERLATSKNALILELAKERLNEFDIRENLARIEKAAAIYRDRLGMMPASMGDLARNGILRIPDPALNPGQGEYYIDPEGALQNSVLLQGRLESQLASLRHSVRKFKKAAGRLPKNLAELDAWPKASVPRHPVVGRDWQYDPETGEVNEGPFK